MTTRRAADGGPHHVPPVEIERDPDGRTVTREESAPPDAGTASMHSGDPSAPAATHRGWQNHRAEYGDPGHLVRQSLHHASRLGQRMLQGRALYDDALARVYSPDPASGVTPSARLGVPAWSVPPPPPLPRLPLSDPQQRIAQEVFAVTCENNPDGLAREYLDRVRAGDIGDAPNVFSTDDAKLLSPHYNPEGVSDHEARAARARMNIAVHNTANAIAKRAFLMFLDALPDDRKTVLVTSGGVASGKGFALGNDDQIKAIAARVGAIWDAAGEQNATENPWILQECRARGIHPIFVFVESDPREAWASPVGGALERAKRQGRTVDERVFVESHRLGKTNFDAFRRKNPDVDCIILENFRTDAGVPVKIGDNVAHDVKELYAEITAITEDVRGGLHEAIVQGATVGRTLWQAPGPGAGGDAQGQPAE